MAQSITLDDVLASAEANAGNVLRWDPDKVRDLKTLNQRSGVKAKFDVTWVNLSFITAAGKLVFPCRLKIENQIIGSGAKAPQSKDDGSDDVAYFSIQFRSLTRADIECGDYVPRVMETEAAQAAENARIAKNIDMYLANNAKMIQALDILNNSFRTVSTEIVEAEKRKELKFTVQKDRKKNDVPVFPIKQSMRYDENERQDVPLQNPIFRIKLAVCAKDGRIGRWSSYNNRFEHTVFDARKMTKKNGYANVPAYVKVGKTKNDLNSKNVAGYITYKSLISGSINFESATISKTGISFGCKFWEIYIVRHKSSSGVETVSRDIISNMRGALGSDDEGSDVELTESKSSKAGNLVETDSDEDHHDLQEALTSEGEDLEKADDPPSDVEARPALEPVADPKKKPPAKPKRR